MHFLEMNRDLTVRSSRFVTRQETGNSCTRLGESQFPHFFFN